MLRYPQKRPFKKFCKERNLRPLIATTCDESLLRAEMYVRRGGCSSFEKNKEASYPLSIFLDSDIYEYIHKFDLRLCDLYKKASSGLAAWRADLGLTSTKKDSICSIKLARVWRKNSLL